MGREARPLRVAPGGDVILTQKDVRQVQLAKAAIRAGLDALLAEAKVRTQDVGACWLRVPSDITCDQTAWQEAPLASAAGCQSGGRGQHMQGGAVTLLSNAGTRRELQAVAGRVRQHRAGQRCGLWSAVRRADGIRRRLNMTKAEKKKPARNRRRKACAHVH